MRKIPTVLVVDGSQSVLHTVKTLLGREGMLVLTASDGLTALTRMVDDVPSVVLVGGELPHMDGYHICQIMKRKSEFRNIPILLLGESDSQIDRMNSRLVGASEYLASPLDPAKLVETIKCHLVNWEERVPMYEEVSSTRSHVWQRNAA